MTEGFFLSDVLHSSDFSVGALNIVVAPCGCGKTTAAIQTMAAWASSPRKALYLIDTRNGCQRLAMNDKLTLPDVFYEGMTGSGLVPFLQEQNQVVVATYAQFGMWVSKYPDFTDHYEVIICDEAHNLYYFSKYSEEPNPASIARDALCHAAAFGPAKVIAITATPKGVAYLRCPKRYIPIDTTSLRHYDQQSVVPYARIEDVFKQLPAQQRGLLYVGKIGQMKEFEQLALTYGHKPFCIWSLSNQDHPMTNEQLAARDYLLKHEEVPPQYDLFIFNGSSETSINLRGHLDFCIVHNANETHITQARGRYRGDLQTLYLLDKERSAIVIDDSFLNRRLFKEDKDALKKSIGIKDEKGRPLSWEKTVQRMTASGYLITDQGRKDNRSYVIISKA